MMEAFDANGLLRLLSPALTGPKLNAAGLTKLASSLVKPPRVGEAGVNFECKVTEIHNLKTASGAGSPSWIVFGEVVAVHIDKALLKGGVFDTFGAGILLRAGGPTAYARITPETRFDMRRPG